MNSTNVPVPKKSPTHDSDVLNSIYAVIFDDFPVPVLLLDMDGRIVYRNALVRELIEPEKQITGVRLGVLLGCSGCSLEDAITAALHDEVGMGSCRISRVTSGMSEAVDLQVWAKSVFLGADKRILLTLMDTSLDKRMADLERSFFHDILNIASGLKSIHEGLGNMDIPPELKGLILSAKWSSRQLIREIESQKIIIDAEKNGLDLVLCSVQSEGLLEEIIRLYESHPAGEGKRVEVSEASQTVVLKSDPVLLKRVIGNMLKNGLESSATGETVIVGCRRLGDRIHFWVRNESCIPEETQSSIFQRSFSTKGRDRGIGTYGIKLLAERFLGGRVTFHSDREEGTIFTLSLPVNGPVAARPPRGRTAAAGG